MSNSQEPFEYEGLNGNGDSLASARLTWLASLWLLNKEPYAQQLNMIAHSVQSVAEAATDLQAWVQTTVMNELLKQPSLASDLVQNILQHEINWQEIVLKARDQI